MGTTDFDRVVRDHEARVTRYLTGILGDSTLAQDLAQETFIRAHTSFGELEDSRASTAWIFRIAHNLAVDFRRSRASRDDAATASLDDDVSAAEDIPADVEDLSVEARLEENEMAACVRSYIQDLPPSLRECVMLRDLEGLGEQTVADIVGCSLAAVKVRTHRARRQLRDRLRRECDFYQDQRGVLMCEPAEIRSKCKKEETT